MSVTLEKLPAHTGRLNDAMEFDHVVRVLPGGTVIDAPGFYAPGNLDGDLDDPDWEFFTTGYSGQDRYTGPWMHNSELLAGGLADDILAEPGLYVAVVGYHTVELDETGHPVHGGCWDGCGLAVDHDGACLDRPGGREQCEHDSEDPDVEGWAVLRYTGDRVQ